MKINFNKLIILISINIFCLMFPQDVNKLKIYYNKTENLLTIKTCGIDKTNIDERLRLFNNQYPNSESYFQLEIFENNKQICPTALDVLISKTEDLDITIDNQEKFLKSNNEKDVFSFVILDEKNIKNQINKLKNSNTIYYYNFKKNVEYKLKVFLVQKSKIYESNFVKFLY